MDSEKYLARVGGIAVAVGLGAALVSGQGVAFADSTESNSSSDAASDGGASDSDADSDEDRDTESESEDGSSEDDAASEAETEADETEEQSSESESEQPDSDDEVVVAEPETPEETIEPEISEDGSGGDVVDVAVRLDDDARRSSTTEIAESSVHTFTAPVSVDQPAAIAATDPTDIVRSVITLAPNIIRAAQVMSYTVPTPAQVIADPGAAVFGLGVLPAPGHPWQPVRHPRPPSLLEVAYAFWRRVESQFFNSTPTATYVVNPQQVGDTVITGAVIGSDANRDPLTYNVVGQPGHGTVVMQRDGTFTYTPDPEWAHETAGSDSFTVVVSDRGSQPHLHLLSRTKHTTEIKVAVDVAQVNEEPTIAVDSVVENEDGTVTYTVSTADGDGDDVAVTVGTLQHGTIDDHLDGTYTYTPGVNRTDTAVTETIVFTADDAHGGQQSVVELVTIDPGQEEISVISVPASGQSVVTTADGTRTFVGQGGRITVIDTSDPANPVIVSVQTSANAYEIAMSDDGTRAYAVGGNGPLVMVDASDLDDVKVKEISLSQTLNDVAVTPDGNTVYVTTATTNRAIIRVDTSAGIDNAVVTPITIPTQSQFVEVSDDGTKVWVTTYEDEVLLINMEDPATPVVSVVTAPGWSYDFVISADGTRAVVLGYNNESYVLDASDDFTTVDVTTLNVGRSNDVAITPDGNAVYFASWNQKSIVEADITDIDNPVITTIAADYDALELAVSADGKRVYTANYGFESASVFDTTTDTMLSTVHTGSRPVAVAVSADGSKAYVVNRDSKTVSVIEDYSI